jgi:hypothetical protein
MYFMKAMSPEAIRCCPLKWGKQNQMTLALNLQSVLYIIIAGFFLFSPHKVVHSVFLLREDAVKFGSRYNLSV